MFNHNHGLKPVAINIYLLWRIIVPLLYSLCFHLTKLSFSIPMLEEHLCVTSSTLYFSLCVLCVFFVLSVVRFPLNSAPQTLFVIFFARKKQKSRQKGWCAFNHNHGLKPVVINIYLLWRIIVPLLVSD